MKLNRNKFHVNSGLQVANTMNILEEREKKVTNKL